MSAIKLSTGNLAYHDQGTGPTILFIHGFPLSKEIWEAQLMPLSSQFRVLIPDLPGYGGSEPIDGELSLVQIADCLAEFLSRLEITSDVTVCGLSMGGYIAWEMWSRHSSLFARLALVHTRAAADDATTARGRRLAAENVLQSGTKTLIEGMLPRMLPAGVAQEQPQLAANLLHIMEQATPQVVAQSLLALAERADHRPTLSSVTVPTLVVCGTEDPITPTAEMLDMAKQIPGSRWELLDGCGHLSPLQMPEAFNRILVDFLTSTRD
jgi:pimeloyl-ACP methyl ester carboxylesterase